MSSFFGMRLPAKSLSMLIVAFTGRARNLGIAAIAASSFASFTARCAAASAFAAVSAAALRQVRGGDGRGGGRKEEMGVSERERNRLSGVLAWTKRAEGCRGVINFWLANFCSQQTDGR